MSNYQKIKSCFCGDVSWWVFGCLGAPIFLFVFANLCGSVWDIDAYWHLASGKYVFGAGSLPQVDPFGTTERIDTGREAILSQYWLAQVVLYGSYLLFIDYGIILLRCFLFLLIFTLVAYRFKAADIEKLFFLPFLLLLGFVAGYFNGDRPQLFSFLFFTLLICQLEAVSTKDKSATRRTAILVSVPLLLLVWANMHPGYLLGVLVILLYLIVDFYKCLRNGTKIDRSMYALLLAAALLTGLNPNGYALFVDVMRFEGTELQGRTSEYMPPWQLFPELRLSAYWIYSAVLVLVIFVRHKSVKLVHLILFAVLFVLSLRATRYIPFFVFGTAVLLPGYLSFARGKKILAAALLLLCFVVVGFQGAPALQKIKGVNLNPVDGSRFPQKVVAYMQEKGLSGHVFNHINFGGYLIFHLFPDCQMMIDGRNLNKDALTDYTRILWLPAVSEALLDARQVDLVVIPERNPFSKEHYPLFDLLRRSPAWQMVYREETAALFVRTADSSPVQQVEKLDWR